MAIKSILVPFAGTHAELSALDAAFNLSKDFNAKVSCYFIEKKLEGLPSMLDNTNNPLTKEFLHNLEGDLKDHVQITLYRLKQQESKQSVAGSDNVHFYYRPGAIEAIIQRQGRISDLIIVSQRMQSKRRDYKAGTYTALFETGRPVLFTPPKMPDVLGYTIAIAWSGSAEVSSTISRAIPLLKQARNVYILTVGKSPSNAPGGKDAVDYLALHGIHATLVPLNKSDSIGKLLLSQCDKLNVDLLCMGAFTHSRVQQMLMGGVTTYMFDNATIPILMAR